MRKDFSLRGYCAGSDSAHTFRLDRSKRLKRAVKAIMEPLETRVLMTASVWSATSSSTANWNVAANWSPNTYYPHTSSDSANLNVDITTNQAISLGTNLSVNSLTVGDSTLTGGVGQSETINAGNTLTFDNGSSSASLTLDSGAVGFVTIAAPITLSSNLTITNNSSQTLTLSGGITTNGHTLTVNGSGSVVISGAIGGSGTVTKNDAGTLSLSANNSYNGITTLNGGTILANQAASIGTGTSFNLNGGTYEATASFSTSKAFVLNGGSIAVDAGQTLTSTSSSLSGTGGLTKLGGGTVRFSAGSVTFSGNITISAGSIAIGNLGSSTSPVSLSSGSLEITQTLSSARPFTLGGGTLTVDSAKSLTLSGAISGSGALTQAGAGTLILSNSSNSYSGGTALSAGTLKLAASGALPTGDLSVSGTLDLSSYSVIVNGLSGSGTIDKSATGSTTFTVGNSDASGVFSGTIKNTSGSLALTKVGSGTITLSGTNTYSGTTTISGGSLQIGNGGTSGTLGTGSVVDNASLAFDRSDNINVTNNISGTGGIVQNGSGNLNLAGYDTYTGGVTINAGTVTTLPLPSPWSSAAIGTTSGWASGDGSGNYSIIGSGSIAPDTFVWAYTGDTSDSFNMAYQSLGSNQEIAAEVTSQQNTNSFAKAGVMLRSSTAADAAFVGLFATPGKGVVMLVRATDGATVSCPGYNPSYTGNPIWLKLTTQSGVITGYVSLDGTHWSVIGQTSSVTLGSTPIVGLAVDSTSSTGATSTATFTNVSVGAISTATVVPAIAYDKETDTYSGSDGRLVWHPIAGATTITVQQSSNGGATYQNVAVIPGTADTYLPNDLLPQTTYKYRLAASNSAGTTTTPSINLTTGSQLTQGYYQVTASSAHYTVTHDDIGMSTTGDNAPVMAQSPQQAELLTMSGSAYNNTRDLNFTLGNFQLASSGNGYYGNSYGFTATTTEIDWNDTHGYYDSVTQTDGHSSTSGEKTSHDNPCDCPDCCSESTTQKPIAYADGSPVISVTDLSSPGFTGAWSVARNWTTQTEFVADNTFGYGWMNNRQSYLQNLANYGLSGVLVVNSAYDQKQFNFNGTSYVPTAVTNDSLTYDATAHTYTWLEAATGATNVYYDFSTSTAASLQGKLKAKYDAAGNSINLTYNGSGQLATVTQTDAAGDTESFNYTYFTTGANAGQVSSIQQSMQRAGASSPTIYRQAVYTYYQGTYSGSDAYGNQGDLKTVTIEDGSGNSIDFSYYRYYTPADLAAGQQGYVGGLKYIFQSDSYARLVAAYSNPFSATDTQVAPYANNFFAYDSLQRAIQETAAGDGASGNNGLGTTYLAYYQNPNFPTSGTPDFNTWWMRTTETLPDGNQNIVYTNINKQALLKISVDAVDPGSPSTVGVNEITAYQFDSFGRLIATINPSAINNSFYNIASPSSYEAYADLGITEGGVNSSSGLVQTTSYYSSTTATGSTAGGAEGFVQADYLQQGLSGTPVEQDSYTYFAHTDSNGNTIYPQAAYTLYRNSNGTGAETTSYSYAFYTGTNQPYSIATSAPVISSGQNGPGTADVTTDVYDTYGNRIWERDPNGYISYNGIDLPTGAIVQFIQDVNTSSLSELVDDVVPLATGWTTPTGAGLNLVASMQVDSLGRTTEETSPNGNLTYIVYDDPNHEVRVYSGWNASTGTTTGPTQIYHQDWGRGYTETLTTSDAPAVTGSSGSYVPTGAEAITAGNIQSLSRSLMDNSDQVIETDCYFTMSGISSYSTATFHLGTTGTNYYSTTYAFDAEGRQYQTTEPTGTIDVTTFDGFDRVVGSWVGTNSVTSDGNAFNGTNAGSGNNMIEVESGVYDNGGTGDSKVTETTDYPGDGMPARITQTAYDWRDRAIASEAGIATGDTTTPRSITYTTYDNLNERTEQDAYDGTGVFVSSLGSTSGVPNVPTSQLLAKKTAGYDDQRRVYQTSVFSVDPSTGTVGSSITTNTFFDHNGNVVATFTPGQPTIKYLYDGANRVIATYTTDGGAVNNSGSPLLDWSHAESVANDVVVSETDATYDANGNTILTVSKDRLPTADTTTTDALSSSNSRISYVGDFYDASNRLVAEENVGTNGGSTWTLPSSPDSRDDTHLITSYTYDAAGNQDGSTDPRGIVTKSYFDLLGRTTETIGAYTDGIPTNDTNQTTTYTYDGNGDVLTMTAVMPSGAPSQTTAYIYGVGSSGALFSNDLIAGAQYPDKSTGYASSDPANDVAYAYDNLGETTVKVDQNGTTHNYSYDPFGRLTLDGVSLASGSAIDSAVLALGYSYNALGLPYQQTSYSDPAGITIVNQDQDVYNGLQQMTVEYQSVSGPVNTITTPKVQYAYSSVAAGSLPTEMIYPNGRILHYGYDNNDLDAALARVDYLADDNGSGAAGSHLADYGFEGLNTILSQADGNGVTLTTTLDEIGRIAEINWVNTGAGISTDDFQYGYDRDNNLLYAINGTNSSFSQLYHANSTATGDNSTAYDELNRLIAFSRGTLTASGNNGTNPDTVSSGNLNILDGSTQTWNLDAAGNQTAVTTDGTTANKTTNSQNETTGLGGNILAYDNDGNMTTDESGNTLKYDAWNRLTSITNSSSVVLASYIFDARGRRISETHGSATTAIYFSAKTQAIEEFQAGSVIAQNVWSIDYINDLLLRDDNSSGGNLGLIGSGLGQRLYVQHDANFNVTVLADVSGNVLERFIYTPYGLRTSLSASWVSTSDIYGVAYSYQGGRFDQSTGLYHFGAPGRDYSPSAETWEEADPGNYINGANRYQMEVSGPDDHLDPSGWDAVPTSQPTTQPSTTVAASGSYSTQTKQTTTEVDVTQSIGDGSSIKGAFSQADSNTNGMSKETSKVQCTLKVGSLSLQGFGQENNTDTNGKHTSQDLGGGGASLDVPFFGPPSSGPNSPPAPFTLTPAIQAQSSSNGLEVTPSIQGSVAFGDQNGINGDIAAKVGSNIFPDRQGKNTTDWSIKIDLNFPINNIWKVTATCEYDSDSPASPGNKENGIKTTISIGAKF